MGVAERMVDGVVEEREASGSHTAMIRARLEEVLQAGCDFRAAVDLEDVAGKARGIELDVVARPVPRVAFGGEQVFDFVGAIVRNVEGIEGQRDETRLSAVRIKVDDHQQEVGTVVRLLAVTDELIVVDRMELERPIVLQRGVVVANFVDARDERPQAIGAIAVPVAYLVFFRVEIFLSSRFIRR